MKKILLIFLTLSFSIALLAQEEISSTVEVKREFEGKLLEISKSKLDTKYSDTLTKLHLNFDYSVFDRPMKDLYEFSPMQSAHLKRDGLVRYPVLYAKIAMSYPWMPEADIYIQPRLGDRFSMVIYGNHHSFWGHKGNDTLGPALVNRMVNKGGLNMTYIWKRGELTANGFYSHNLYYYNNYFRDSNSYIKSTTFQHIGADLRVRSTKAEPTVFYYDARVKYLNTVKGGPNSNTITENRFDIDAVLGMTIRYKHKILLGVRSENAFLSSSPYYSLAAGNLEIVPHYKFDYGRWRFRAGAAFAFRYQNDLIKHRSVIGTTAASIAKVYPDVYVGFEAAKNALWLYARADGENKMYSPSTMLGQNPWIWTWSYHPPYMGNISTPINAELGLNGVVKDLFSYSVSGAYTHYDTYLTYRSASVYQIPYVFANVDVICVKAEALFKSKAFSAGASGKYSYFFDPTQIPFMVPSFKVYAFGKYNYRERIFFEVNVNYYSKMKCLDNPISDIPGFVNLGARLTFAINSKFSAYLQGQNLINQKIMYIQNYLEPGINFGLGLYFKL